MYRIGLIKRPGVYFLAHLSEGAFKRDGRLFKHGRLLLKIITCMGVCRCFYNFQFKLNIINPVLFHRFLLASISHRPANVPFSTAHVLSHALNVVHVIHCARATIHCHAYKHGRLLRHGRLFP